MSLVRLYTPASRVRAPSPLPEVDLRSSPHCPVQKTSLWVRISARHPIGIPSLSYSNIETRSSLLAMMHSQRGVTHLKKYNPTKKKNFESYGQSTASYQTWLLQTHETVPSSDSLTYDSWETFRRQGLQSLVESPLTGTKFTDYILWLIAHLPAARCLIHNRVTTHRHQIHRLLIMTHSSFRR